MASAAAAAFEAVHAPQLQAAAFPRALYNTLREKLTHEARTAAFAASFCACSGR